MNQSTANRIRAEILADDAINNSIGGVKKAASSSEDAFRIANLDEMLANMMMPNGPGSGYCVAWMKDYFTLVGDPSPNSGEIHLEMQDKKDVYKEYRADFDKVIEFEEVVSYSYFLKLWDTMFKHVKIREYKSVTGKCHFCAVLTELRAKSKKKIIKQRITDMHALHRVTYMMERQAYYQNVRRSIEDPDNYMSIILDGMSQNHTVLPYIANMKQFPSPLAMHLQGVIEHGQTFTMYRTYENLRGGCNLAIHCILRQLEKRIEYYGHLPPTIYIQIDGGSENTNQYVLALCEFIVARRLTSRIFLTRLPVGHTHEDIDARFGKLWVHIRSKLVLSHIEYERAMQNCYGDNSLPFYWEDIFAVPNYKALFAPYIDDKIGSYAKEDDTQLAWKFEAIKRCDQFPLGVRTMYRAYASDEVFEINKVTDDRKVEIPDIPYAIVRTKCRWQPAKLGQEEMGVLFDGLHVLNSFPVGPIVPASFKKGHLKEFNNCIKQLKKDKWCGGKHSYERLHEVLSHWESFKDVYPQTDDVETYLQTHELHVPLRQKLFDYIGVMRFYRDDDETPDYVDFEKDNGPTIPLEQTDNARCGINSLNILAISQQKEDGITRAATTTAASQDEILSPQNRALKNIRKIETAVNMPSVLSNSNPPPQTNVYIHPRLPLTDDDQRDLISGSTNVNKLREKVLSLPLFDIAYEDITVVELKNRLHVQKVHFRSDANKADLFSLLTNVNNTRNNKEQGEEEEDQERKRTSNKKGHQQMLTTTTTTAVNNRNKTTPRIQLSSSSSNLTNIDTSRGLLTTQTSSFGHQRNNNLEISSKSKATTSNTSLLNKMVVDDDDDDDDNYAGAFSRPLINKKRKK